MAPRKVNSGFHDRASEKNENPNPKPLGVNPLLANESKSADAEEALSVLSVKRKIRPSVLTQRSAKAMQNNNPRGHNDKNETIAPGKKRLPTSSSTRDMEDHFALAWAIPRGALAR